MKRFAFLLVLTAWSAGSAWAAGCDRIVVSSDPDYPPISWRDREHPQQIIGVAIEIVERAFAEKNIKVESRYVGPWKRVLADRAQLDVIAGLYLTAPRQAYLNFIEPPVMSDPSVIFVRTGTLIAFRHWQDLAAYKGAVRLGDSFGERFDRFATGHLRLEKVRQFEQLSRMTIAGHVDYFIYGLYPGLAMTEKLGLNRQLEHLSPPVSEEKIYIALTKHSKCLAYAGFLQRKVQEYVKQVLPQALSKKYLTIWKQQSQLPAAK